MPAKRSERKGHPEVITVARDIDQIIERLEAEIPGLYVEQLRVTHPEADDDGLWFIRIHERKEEVQIESSNGVCPFLIESDFNSERLLGHSVEEVVANLLEDASVELIGSAARGELHGHRALRGSIGLQAAGGDRHFFNGAQSQRH